MNDLNAKKLEVAVRRRELVKSLIGGKARFLAEYRLSNYVKAAQIDDVNLGATRRKMPASQFFKDKAGLLLSIEGAGYKKPFNVVLFDSFIVVEMAPGTQHTQFLVLIPNFESQSGFYVVSEEKMTGTSVLDTADAVKRNRGQAHVLSEAENILAALFAPGRAGSAG